VHSRPSPCLASLDVRTHQDGNYDFDLLSRPAQFNILGADHLATEVLPDIVTIAPVAPLFSEPYISMFQRHQSVEGILCQAPGLQVFHYDDSNSIYTVDDR
jgi:hypothetical protein